MLAFLVSRVPRIALLVTLTIALVGTGFAHQISTVDGQKLAFALATGATAADICDDATPGGEHRKGQCHACRIAGGVDLPGIGGIATAMELSVVRAISVPVEMGWVLSAVDLAHPAQAPPAA